MQETDRGSDLNKEFGGPLDVEGPDFQDLEPRPFTPPARKRLLIFGSVLAVLVMLAVLPPLINVNRFRRQIATSIGASLGRPVHLGSVALSMFPLPGLTLEDFVVSEDPAFGAEPIIRANSVRATLRVSSLWRRRVEFSRISLDEPTSLNLVHLPDGRWNIEGILLQAARMKAAPTGQKGVGDAPRFPYIEATGARVNLKMGLEKMPLSLTEAKFALWLPEPEIWKLRLEAHPTRTDTAATDTGLLRLDATLGRAARLQDVPLEVQGEWTAAPLGAVSKVLVGWDAGFRGQLDLVASVRGTMGENLIESKLLLNQVRQSDFVPARTLDVDLSCKAQAAELFHSLHHIRCAWPANSTNSGMVVTGDLPEILRPQSAIGSIDIKAVPAGRLLDGLRLVSSRIPPQLVAEGELAGSFKSQTQLPGARASKARERQVRLRGSAHSGEFTVMHARLAMEGGSEFLNDDVSGQLIGKEIIVRPIPLQLGAATSASVEGHVDRSGYSMHLTGPLLPTRLLELAAALPQFGDGLKDALAPASSTSDLPTSDLPTSDVPTSRLPTSSLPTSNVPTRVDLISSRHWGGSQTWRQAVAVGPGARKRQSRVR